MSKLLSRQLARLERRLLPPRRVTEVIIIRGGLCDGDPSIAAAGPGSWTRMSDEPFAEFYARVLAEATQAEEPLLIFGGLPSNDL